MRSSFDSLQELLLELREETSPRLETKDWAQEAGVTETYLNRLIRADELPAWAPDRETVERVLRVLAERLEDTEIVACGLAILGFVKGDTLLTA